jgi:hypothetical protein
MRKILVTIIVLTCLMSCEDDNQEYNDDTYVRVPKLTTITYDSCEYVVGVHSGSGVITHKGNCRFCKERKENEKRIEDFMQHVRNILSELEKHN